MKKSRLLSLLLCLVLATGLLTTFAAASSGSAILDEMDVNAKAAILADPNTGEILYEKNAHEKMYPASITKVMTCLLTLEAVDRGELSLEQVVTAGSGLHTGIGANASTADIKEGEQIRIIDLLYAALIPSANEACNVMAEAVSGDVASFVELMNQRALCGADEPAGRGAGHDGHPFCQHPRLPRRRSLYHGLRCLPYVPGGHEARDLPQNCLLQKL